MAKTTDLKKESTPLVVKVAEKEVKEVGNVSHFCDQSATVLQVKRTSDNEIITDEQLLKDAFVSAKDNISWYYALVPYQNTESKTRRGQTVRKVMLHSSYDTAFYNSVINSLIPILVSPRNTPVGKISNSFQLYAFLRNVTADDLIKYAPFYVNSKNESLSYNELVSKAKDIVSDLQKVQVSGVGYTFIDDVINVPYKGKEPITDELLLETYQNIWLK